MKQMPRDLDQYAESFQKLAFEPILAAYRRSLVLRQLQILKPGRILEVGCGMLPLFTDLPETVKVTVIDPIGKFVDNARLLAKDRGGISIFQACVEDFFPEDTGFDVIVLSCVLHEVPDPRGMLSAVRRLCDPQTILHVNVPNAASFHRQLAVSMGLISFAGAASETQRTMQQRLVVYDRESLVAEMTETGFEVLDQGGIFVKPFTHSQMQKLVDFGFLTPDLLDGLDKLAEKMPDLSSEIWLNARRTS